jgi:histidine triad (HIT) family protein
MSESPLVNSPCIFCRILDGSEPASFLYRDDRCAAFMDIQPINQGHLLIIPNHHSPSLADTDPETLVHLMRVAHKLTAALRTSGLRCEGVNLFLADGEVAGQEVFHVHLHVLPRYRGDGFGLRFGPHYSKRPRAELDDVARMIRQAFSKVGGTQ